jgi:hypothetical protein
VHISTLLANFRDKIRKKIDLSSKPVGGDNVEYTSYIKSISKVGPVSKRHVMETHWIIVVYFAIEMYTGQILGPPHFVFINSKVRLAPGLV